MRNRRSFKFSARVVLLSVLHSNAVLALLQLTTQTIAPALYSMILQVAAGAGGVVVNNNSSSTSDGNSGLGGRRGKSKLDKLQLDLEVQFVVLQLRSRY
jgi:hypothetical protein